MTDLIEAPFEYRDGRMWVSAKISGQEVRGILDTGSDGTAVDSEFAQSIGLASHGGKSATTVAGGVDLQRVGRLDFEIGGKVLSSSEANKLPLSSQLEGLRFILGYDALEDSPFVIRQRDLRLIFGPFENVRGSPFVLGGDIRPTARLEVLGASSHAFLDTGSAQGLSLPRRWVEANAQRLGINVRAAESRKILGKGVDSLKFTLEEMTLGGSVLTEVPAEAVESEEGSFAEQSTFWGNVGNRVLQRFESIAIDGRRRIVYFGEKS